MSVTETAIRVQLFNTVADLAETKERLVEVERKLEAATAQLKKSSEKTVGSLLVAVGSSIWTSGTNHVGAVRACIRVVGNRFRAAVSNGVRVAAGGGIRAAGGGIRATRSGIRASHTGIRAAGAMAHKTVRGGIRLTGKALVFTGKALGGDA
jgi:tetrahydromethanopterin S-methyltransferase subunit G